MHVITEVEMEYTKIERPERVYYEEVWWNYGKPKELFSYFEEHIGKFVENLGENVIVIDEQFFTAPITAPITQKAVTGDTKTIEARVKKWWCGGMRAPHLHFKDKVYLLTQKQWDQFLEEQIFPEFQKNLSKVKAVSFNQVMQLSDAVVGIRPTPKL